MVEADAYLDTLEPEQRARYEAQPSDPTLDREIRLLRYVLSELSAHPHTNARDIAAVVLALCRTVYVHTRHAAGGSDIEDDLMTAGAAALDLSRLED